MDNIKQYLSEKINANTNDNASIKELKLLLKQANLNNKNKQILQGYLVNESSMALNQDKESLKWFFKIYTLLENADTKPIRNEVYFSPGEDCRNAIVEEIRKAIKSLQVCVFTISDDLIAKEIINCKKRGVSVKVITDDNKSMDRGSDIHEMADAGIPTKMDTSPNHMHHKFAIIDNETLITGSYNWTRSAYVSNQENILVSNSPDVIEKYQKEFEKLWDIF